MVEFFTKEHDTNLSKERASMVEIVDETITQNLKSNLQKLVKEPSPKTLENILNYSRSLKR